MTDDDDIQFIDAPAPTVVMWFKIYSGLLCLLYLGVMGVSPIFFFVPAADLDMEELEAVLVGVFCLVMGLPLFVACLIPLVVAPRPWVWVYDLVIICLGMTSACCMLASIPLLIFWLKPETKQYFGRT